MSKPSKKNNLPDFSGQSKIMFYTEGNSAALLLENKAGQRATARMNFPTAEAALGWCRQNLTTLVYMPVNLEAN